MPIHRKEELQSVPGPPLLPSCRRRDFFDVPPDGLVAFAGSRLEAAPVDDFDVPAVIAEEAGLLQHIGDDGHGRAAYAEHLRQEFVRELDGVAFEPVAGCSSQRLRRASTGCNALQAAVC